MKRRLKVVKPLCTFTVRTLNAIGGDWGKTMGEQIVVNKPSAQTLDRPRVNDFELAGLTRAGTAGQRRCCCSQKIGLDPQGPGSFSSGGVGSPVAGQKASVQALGLFRVTEVRVA